MLSILVDIEWLLSTLFDASLLTFEPPETAAPFLRCPVSRHFGAGFDRIDDRARQRRGRQADGRTGVVPPPTILMAVTWNGARP